MACATLKRSLEWEPMLGGRPVKRRRCIPFSASPSNYQERDTSDAVDVVPTSPKTESVFPDVLNHKLTPEHMAESIKAEIRRLQKRRQLHYNFNAMENSSDSGSGGEQSESPPHTKDRPLFTLKEVGVICERMIRERETEIRQEYDNVLTAKLAEQYDAFVRFTYDQIQRSYHQSAPSYLS